MFYFLLIKLEMGRITAGDPLGGNSLWQDSFFCVEMMGIEPMSKFETQKIIYKFSLFVFEQFFK